MQLFSGQYSITGAGCIISRWLVINKGLVRTELPESRPIPIRRSKPLSVLPCGFRLHLQ